MEPETQRALFRALFVHLGGRDDLVNKVVEISVSGGEVSIAEYDLPPP